MQNEINYDRTLFEKYSLAEKLALGEYLIATNPDMIHDKLLYCLKHPPKYSEIEIFRWIANFFNETPMSLKNKGPGARKSNRVLARKVFVYIMFKFEKPHVLEDFIYENFTEQSEKLNSTENLVKFYKELEKYTERGRTDMFHGLKSFINNIKYDKSLRNTVDLIEYYINKGLIENEG